MRAARTNPAVIVIGGSGELGQAVVRQLLDSKDRLFEYIAGLGIEVIGTYKTSKPLSQLCKWVQLDLDKDEEVMSFLKLFKDTEVVAVFYCAVPKHVGAYTTDIESMEQGIVQNPLKIASWAVDKGARFLGISTDQVFDGRTAPAGERPYTENDTCTPMNEYGRAKVRMEEALLNLKSEHVLIVRISLVITFTPRMGKAVNFLIRALQPGESEPVVLFTDEPRNMALSQDLAMQMIELALSSHGRKVSGVIHLGSQLPTNRYNLGVAMATGTGIGGLNRIKSGLSADSGLNRPLDLSMNTEKASRLLKSRIRDVVEYAKGLSVDQLNFT